MLLVVNNNWTYPLLNLPACRSGMRISHRAAHLVGLLQEYSNDAILDNQTLLLLPWATSLYQHQHQSNGKRQQPQIQQKQTSTQQVPPTPTVNVLKRSTQGSQKDSDPLPQRVPQRTMEENERERLFKNQFHRYLRKTQRSEITWWQLGRRMSGNDGDHKQNLERQHLKTLKHLGQILLQQGTSDQQTRTSLDWNCWNWHSGTWSTSELAP